MAARLGSPGRYGTGELYYGRPRGAAKTAALREALERNLRYAKKHGYAGRRGRRAEKIAMALYHRRNPGPKGTAKTAAIRAAMNRGGRISNRRWLALQTAHTRRILADIKAGRSKSTLRNPGPKGSAKRDALSRAARRREQRFLRTPGASVEQLRRARTLRRAYYRRIRVELDRRRRREKNPVAGLAGLNAANPQRKGRHMARRRTAAQRAAFRKMIAGLKRYKSKRRRRRTPHRKGHTMARRAKHRRRRASRAVVIMHNPRRRRSLSRRRRPGRRMRHHRRRRNPGGPGIKGALRSVFMAGIPAVLAGGAAGFIDAKFLANQNVIVRIIAKVVQAGLAGAMLRRRPIAAYSAMGAIIGSQGYEFGVRMGGGVIAGGTPAAKAAGVQALITEDPRTMGVLVNAMQGLQLDNNVSLGDAAALAPGSYQDVNLG